MSQRYAVIFERAESNWVAYVPDLPGCITTGEIIDETEAIQGHRVHRCSSAAKADVPGS